MIVGIGIDMEEISRIKSLLQKPNTGERAKERLFTIGEIAYCQGHKEPWQHYTARFAAKEAFSKALGTGIWQKDVRWTDIEIYNDDLGKPHLNVSGQALKLLQERGATHALLSLSHAGAYAVAVVVLEN